MKYYILPVFVLLFAFRSNAQMEIRAGMGIEFFSDPSLVQYINQNFAPSSNQLPAMNTAIVFEGEGDRGLSENFMMGVGLSYLINSYTYRIDIGQYNLSYHIISPSILGYYVIPGKGYEFKFGGGFGFPFVSVDEFLPGTGITTYKSNGFSVILKGEGNTLVGDNLYANINVGIKYAFNGTPKSNGNSIDNVVGNEKVSFNSLSFSIGLGVTFKF